MSFYVKAKNGSVYVFATKKDALVYICDNLHREHSSMYLYKDKACKNDVGAVEYMGWGIFNFYRNGLNWDGQTPTEVNPKDGTLFNPFVKKK